ncbi:hypothetical protein SAMN03159293_00712 [Pseudomonas sp. NFACC39-1]|nr:hypothetical protein SAMN03159293_00712 [Pseudomonas sp. NFACC39-1]
MPSLRHYSVGPPRRAIHGPARLSRHPCRDTHCAMPAFGQRGLTGRQDQDQKQSKAKQSKAKQKRDKSSIYVTEPPPSRASPLPQGFAVFTISGQVQKPVGAGLLAKATAQPTSSQTDTPLSWASSLPQGVSGVHSICTRHKKLVGAGLLAKASAQPTSSQTDPPLSRASPLPQGKLDTPKPGRLSGRLALDFDLGRPVNHAG